MQLKSILDRIVLAVRARLDAAPAMPDLERRAADAVARRLAEGRRSLAAALRSRCPAIIAECKHASPSAGVLREPFDPVALARAYAAGGAAAISVVTEQDFFAGDPGWIGLVRAAVPLPVLCKDFVLTERQLWETAALGADAVLLIQRLLDPPILARLLKLARRLSLDVLLELFVDEDPAPAIASGAEIIGVNARDLASFRIDLERVAELARAIPDDRIRVAESGVRGPEDVARLAAAGWHAFLVGEHLVRAPDPEAAVRALVSGR